LRRGAGNSGEMSFSEKELRTLRILFLTLTSLSALGAIFVFVTCAVFREKRKAQTGIYVFFQSFAALLMSFFFILANSYGDQLTDKTALCSFQVWGALFSGNCLVYSWLCITFNIFFIARDEIKKRELRWQVFLPIIFFTSLVCSVLPFGFRGSIFFDGIWCWIEPEWVGLNLVCLRAGLIISSLIGTCLWISTLNTMRLHVVDSKKKANVMVQAESPPQEDTPLMQSVKRNLLIRQMVYIGGFDMILIFVLTENFVMAFSEPSFIAWLLQGIGIGLIGLYLFFVFGATKKNLDLWQEYLK